MEITDPLLSVAELAIALAGFSSLFSVLDRDLESDARIRSRTDLQVMLEIGLRNAAFAAIPIPLIAGGIEGPALWRTLSALYLAAMIGHIHHQRIQGGHGIMNQASDLRLMLVATTVSSMALSVANVLGAGGARAFALYLASLILGLFYAGLLFVAVARRMTWEK